jgi:hypothetical protein
MSRRRPSDPVAGVILAPVVFIANCPAKNRNANDAARLKSGQVLPKHFGCKCAVPTVGTDRGLFTQPCEAVFGVAAPILSTTVVESITAIQN